MTQLSRNYQQILVRDCIAGLLANLSVRDFQEIEGKQLIIHTDIRLIRPLIFSYRS